MSDEEAPSTKDLLVRVKKVEDRLQKLEEEKSEQFENTNIRFSQLLEGIKTEEIAREVLEERRMKDLRLVESASTLEVNMERQNRKESETRLLKDLNDRCVALSVELGAHTYGAHGQSGAAGPAVDPDKILAKFQEERERRENVESELLAKVDDESKVLLEMIDTERRVREEATRTMVVMLEKFGERLSAELDQERKDREATEETILKILEDTATRIETKMKRPY